MKKCLLVVILMCFPISMTYAVKMTSLYQAELSVASQTADVREQAVREGFLQVLIKLSGNPDIGNNPEIRPIVNKASYYVQEYSYALPNPSASNYVIRIHFNATDVNRLLRKAEIPYWGENRPLVLVWLTMTDKNHQSEIIGTESPGELLNMVKQEGNKYGVPLIFPVLDVAEMNQVSANDVALMSLSTLQEAAKRYSPDAMLIGNLMDKDGKIESHWQLILDSNQWSWTITDKKAEDVVATLMNEVCQTLAKRYIGKLANVPQFWLQLEVEKVMKQNDLAYLMQYLKQFSSVEQVQLDQVTGDVVELSVLVHGTVANFQQNAAIDRHLILKSQDNSEKKLIYEWVH